MELALRVFGQKRASRRKYALIAPGFPCPHWINAKAGVRRDWFNCFVAAYRDDEGEVHCWPIGIGRTFWEVRGFGSDSPITIQGKPTNWYGTFWIMI